MKDFDLLKKAWGNLMSTLGDIKAEGETAAIYIEGYDEKRRINGEPVEGEVREYCRCGKKDCPLMSAGASGHTSRFHLQTADGATHVPKSQVEAYRTAAEYNKMYKKALRQINKYRETCEKVYKALGYIGKDRTFESYLKAFV